LGPAADQNLPTRRRRHCEVGAQLHVIPTADDRKTRPTEAL